MDRNTLLWSIVAFLGASIAFNAIQNATDDEGFGVTLLLELAALAAMVALIVVVVRLVNRRSGDDEP
jgi:hypothetical protein